MGSFGGKFGFEFSSLFLFCFCFTRGEQVTDAQDFGWQSKGENHFRSWFPFLIFVYLVTILYCSDIVWSNDLSAHFLYFPSILDREFSFLPFLSPTLWFGNFPSFLFFIFFLFFSCFFCFLPRAWFMVSWDFGSRLVERLVMIYVRVCPTLFPWYSCNNDD